MDQTGGNAKDGVLLTPHRDQRQRCQWLHIRILSTTGRSDTAKADQDEATGTTE
jgi:hypothetical protein